MIEEARIAYEALTPDQKALVTNYETLTTAEAEYKTLDDNAKADEVKAKIATIGTVEYTADSKTKIDEAREAYNALTNEQKALVNTYATLTTAESDYATLKAESKAPKGLSAGAIVAIVLASVVVCGLGGFAIYWFVIKKKTWAEFVQTTKNVCNKMFK